MQSRVLFSVIVCAICGLGKSAVDWSSFCPVVKDVLLLGCDLKLLDWFLAVVVKLASWLVSHVATEVDFLFCLCLIMIN